MDDEDREDREEGEEGEEHEPDAIAAEIQERAWLDTPSATATPPAGDLPDDFAVRSRKPGLWSRIRRAFIHD